MTIFEKSKEIAEYYVVEESSRPWSDIFVSYFPTKEEAVEHAKDRWDHLTASEKRKASVKAMIVDHRCIIDRQIDIDEDKPWWENTADRADDLWDAQEAESEEDEN